MQSMGMECLKQKKSGMAAGSGKLKAYPMRLQPVNPIKQGYFGGIDYPIKCMEGHPGALSFSEVCMYY